MTSDNRNSMPPPRHICASPFHRGPRWMLSVYFYRNKRARTGLQSYCITCTKIRMRAEHLSPAVKKKRSDYSREVKHAQRRAAGIAIRQLHSPWFNGKRLAQFLERFIVEHEYYQNKTIQRYLVLNGVRLDANDGRKIRRWRDGADERVSLEVVDQFASKYELSLWELEEYASTYKLDKRARARSKRIRSAS